MRTMREHDAKMMCDLTDLLAFVPTGSIGVEVGCYIGESTTLMLRSGKFRRLICIDPWEPGYYRDRDMSAAEKEFDRRVEMYRGSTEVMKLKESSRTGLLRAASYGPVNFVYIDGDHRYHAVRDDLERALILLNGRGILAGHDYGRARSPGVKDAVKEVLGFPDVRFAGWSWLKFVDRVKSPVGPRNPSEAVDTGEAGGSPVCGASRGVVSETEGW